MGFLISAMIKLTIWYVRMMIWLVVALVVVIGWCIAAVTGHNRAARSWARSVFDRVRLLRQPGGFAVDHRLPAFTNRSYLL
jgi:hypothetical protein